MKKIVLFLVLLVYSNITFAQVEATIIDSKSVSVPRYTNLADINAKITTPVQGMLVFNNGTQTLWYRNATSWVDLLTSGPWTVNGNDVYRTTGRVGIGTSIPAAPLDVNTTSNYVAQFNGNAPMYMSIFEGGVYRGYWGSYSGNSEDVDFGTGAEEILRVNCT